MTSTTTAQHGAKAHTDGGWDAVPVQTRSERFVSESVDAFPVVTGREAVWKFTPIDRLSALLNEDLDGTRYDAVISATEHSEVLWLSRDEAERGVAGLPEERAAANAWTHTAEVMSISVHGEAEHVEVLRNALGTKARAAHTIITSSPRSHGIVVLRNEGDAQLSENVEIVVGDDSHLTVVSVQQWNAGAHHLSSHFAQIGRNAVLKHIVVSLGGEIVRVNPSLHLAHEGASVDALGAYFSSTGQHLEQQVYVDHNAPHTRSRVTYKGALQGAGARSVWIGDVLIRQSATGTDSYEQNRNLVLTDGTRADSIPNLEIETGDIAGAGHASATGRFDDEQLFYLMSRGIREEEARLLVVRGFLLDVINQIGVDSLEEELREAIEQTLETRTGAAS